MPCNSKSRAIGRPKNPRGGKRKYGGHNLPPMIGIGLTDLPICRGGGDPTALKSRAQGKEKGETQSEKVQTDSGI